MTYLLTGTRGLLRTKTRLQRGVDGPGEDEHSREESDKPLDLSVNAASVHATQLAARRLVLLR